jgi:hypothetical protein
MFFDVLMVFHRKRIKSLIYRFVHLILVITGRTCSLNTFSCISKITHLRKYLDRSIKHVCRKHIYNSSLNAGLFRDVLINTRHESMVFSYIFAHGNGSLILIV